MAALDEHLLLRNPRFRCKAIRSDSELVVSLTNVVEPPASPQDIAVLREIAESNFDALLPMYLARNGLMLHIHGESAGLVIPPIAHLAQLNADWREWHTETLPEDLHDFERAGFAFATIACSGNYFVIFEQRVYYADHDAGGDTPFAADLDDFLSQAVTDPAVFLMRAGCYTRYSDGQTDTQYYPVAFVHD